jgi:hypothetical protein
MGNFAVPVVALSFFAVYSIFEVGQKLNGLNEPSRPPKMMMMMLGECVL